MVDSARSQVISSKGLMMLTHEKDPSDDLRRLLIFRSSSILTMRSSGLQRTGMQFALANCIPVLGPLGRTGLGSRSTRR